MNENFDGYLLCNDLSYYVLNTSTNHSKEHSHISFELLCLSNNKLSDLKVKQNITSYFQNIFLRLRKIRFLSHFSLLGAKYPSESPQEIRNFEALIPFCI